MARDGRNVIHLVRDSNGRPRAMADLPPPNLRRWVPQRKAQVVTAVREGVLTLEQACERYDLSFEEFCSWEQTMDHHGIVGLRVADIQHHRHH
ncbi:MAG TPA: DUF1153 domain-containing protein [Rhizomicrobium sp.]|jgi:hypothetical protein|nr:DUF1153 domain-containing protein [Rhizomicrobium sp.]